jgi:hypothetical protein
VHRVVLLALVGCGRYGFSAPRDAAAGSDSRSADAAPDVPPDAGLLADALAPCTRLAISDNFDDGVQSTVWTLLANNPVTVAETGGTLQVTLATAGGSHYGGYDSAMLFDARDHCLFVSYVQTPTNESMVEMTFALRTAANLNVGFVYHLGVLDPFVNTGTFTSEGGVTFNPTADKILLLREDAGMFTWEASPDGVTFTVLAQKPTPFDVSSVHVILEAGTYGSAPAPGMAIYDDFNSP